MYESSSCRIKVPLSVSPTLRTAFNSSHKIGRPEVFVHVSGSLSSEGIVAGSFSSSGAFPLSSRASSKGGSSKSAVLASRMLGKLWRELS